MKIVRLACPARIGSVSRSPAEGSIEVSDAVADQLHADGLLVEEPESVGLSQSEKTAIDAPMLAAAVEDIGRKRDLAEARKLRGRVDALIAALADETP